MEDFKRRLFLAADYAGDRDPDLRPRHPLVFRAASDMRIGIRLLGQLRFGNFQVDASGKRQHRREWPAVHVAWNYARSSIFRPALRLDQEMVGHFSKRSFRLLDRRPANVRTSEPFEMPLAVRECRRHDDANYIAHADRALDETIRAGIEVEQRENLIRRRLRALGLREDDD